VSARRVCYVLGTTGGGTGRHVAMLAWGCALAGRQVQVVGPAGAWPASEFEPRASAAAASRVNIGFEVVAIGDRLRPGRDSAAVRRLRRLLAATAPDLVHAHGLRAAGLAALALGRSVSEHRPGYRPPALVVTVHNAPPTGAAAVAVYALLERLVARRADVVLGVSSDLSERMSRLGAREVGRAIVPAPASASASAVGHTRDSASIDGDLRPADLGQAGRPVVLAVGRLAAQKGLDTLIEAAGRWQDRVPEPLLAIAGTGPLARDLAAKARRRRVRASFLGWRDDVPALLAAADVFVLPSRWEGQPLILQEALRAGRPVVATDVGGVRGLTGGHSALLVPPGDPDALAAAVLSVLDSPATAARLAAAAADRAAALPTETDAITAALALYDRLTKRADQRPD
jgi:glycosyltransferase involved in cell wall biosynthesis